MEEKASLLGGCTSCPKYWKELTADEKIERLREELKNTQRQLRNSVQLSDKLLHIVYEHKHVNDMLMLPATRHNQYGLVGEDSCLKSSSANPDEVYF